MEQLKLQGKASNKLVKNVCGWASTVLKYKTAVSLKRKGVVLGVATKEHDSSVK